VAPGTFSFEPFTLREKGTKPIPEPLVYTRFVKYDQGKPCDTGGDLARKDVRKRNPVVFREMYEKWEK
jgi:hypothetical protein